MALLTRALELHQRRRTARAGARRTSASIDLKDDSNGLLASNTNPANTDRGAMGQSALVKNSIHQRLKVHAYDTLRNERAEQCAER